MRKLLNTLYVTIPNAYLSKAGETVLVRVEQETVLRVRSTTWRESSAWVWFQ
jgi:CRISPR-associated protein Cas1